MAWIRRLAPLLALLLVVTLVTPAVAVERVSGSKDQAITASYLGDGNELEIIGPGHLEFWVESTAVDWTYKYKVNGGDWLEETVTAGTEHRYITLRRGTVVLLDVKMASGTSNVKVQRS